MHALHAALCSSYQCAEVTLCLLLSAAVCKRSCINGKCVGPDKCSCSMGYKGPQCNEGGVSFTKSLSVLCFWFLNHYLRHSASFTTRISICRLNNVSYWLQMWMSAVCRRGRVPSAAWIRTVAIAVTVNLDTHSVQMDTPAPVSNFLWRGMLKIHIKKSLRAGRLYFSPISFLQKAFYRLHTIIGG